MFEDANYITSAPTRKQTDRLTDSVESDGNSFTKNELVEKNTRTPNKGFWYFIY